jgi:hypothetical protein
MGLTTKQREARAENEKVLARNFPKVDATKLQNALFALAVKCERNAMGICNEQGWEDQRDSLRDQLAELAKRFKIALRADVTGDPRGFCLKLHLPDGSHNTWGGKESGWGIGSVE